MGEGARFVHDHRSLREHAQMARRLRKKATPASAVPGGACPGQ